MSCAHLFTLVMKFHDRQSSERCIRKLISRHCLDKTRTRWNDFLFLITDDHDFRPQTCTNGLVFRECKHIKNIFEDVYFTKNSYFKAIELYMVHNVRLVDIGWIIDHHCQYDNTKHEEYKISSNGTFVVNLII